MPIRTEAPAPMGVITPREVVSPRETVRNEARRGLAAMETFLAAQPFAPGPEPVSTQPTRKSGRTGRMAARIGLILPTAAFGAATLGPSIAEAASAHEPAVVRTAGEMGLTQQPIEAGTVVTIRRASQTVETRTVEAAPALGVLPASGVVVEAPSTLEEAPTSGNLSLENVSYRRSGGGPTAPEITDAEITTAVTAGVIEKTTLDKQDSCNIWTAYKKGLPKGLTGGKNAPLNALSRMSVQVSRADAEHNKKKFNPNAMQDSTEYYQFTDQAQGVIELLLKVDVKQLDANTAVPDNVVKMVRDLQDINEQSPETGSTTKDIQAQNLLATDQVITLIANLADKAKTDVTLKAKIDATIKKLTDGDLTKKELQAVANTFLTDPAVLTALN